MNIVLPKVAWLVINSGCNLRCNWCYLKGGEYNEVDMPFDLLKKIVPFLKELGITNVTLLGGEPTLHPRLVEIIKELSEYGIKSWMITNGKKLKDKELSDALVKAGLGSVGISIKGADDAHYRDLAGSLGFSEAMLGFQNLNELGIKLSISITWVKELATRYIDVLENLINNNITNIGMDFGTPFVVGESISVDNILDPRESADLIGKVYQFLVEKKDVNFSFYITFPLCLIEKEIRNKLIKQKVISTTCHVPSGSAIILDQSGRILPCCHMSNVFLGKFGVDFNDRFTFERFWNNAVINEFRCQCQLFPHDICSECDEWSICGGGCLINWMYWSPCDFITKERR
jgi:radical SAM protein with 4Fe4S-binding SPASM domain